MEGLCQTQQDVDLSYLAFARRVLKERIPISGDIEITRQCNFNCIHCYLGEASKRQESSADELTTQQWINIIDELALAGCLYLLITGGDPLLRKDFEVIYVHAKKKGLIVTVFTNGSLISGAIIELFKEYPPYSVEITLYGASESTYQAVTGRSGMYERCLSSIEALISAGIQTMLKMILMTENQHEFESIQKLAEDFGAKFRFDGMIFPCLNGDPGPIAYRVPPEKVAELNLSSEKLIDDWEQTKERMKHIPASDSLYSCGAGVTNFHIDFFGLLKPCILATDVTHNLLNGSFNDGWHHIIPKIKKKKNPLEFECKNCESQLYCGFCPAFFRLETGSETEVSEYLCHIGKIMNEKIREKKVAGAS